MLKFDKNLSAVHGYLCSDGYVIRNPPTQRHKYYKMGLRNYNETLLVDFQEKFNSVFGIKPNLQKDGRCTIGNKEIYYKLTNDFSYYSREWRLPKLSKDNLRYWLRAFFDCEGWVMCRKAKDRHIGADSVNYGGLKQIKKSLSRLNITSKLKKIKDKGIWRLHIFGKDNLIKFQKEINFLHPIKNKKLQKSIDSYVNYKWEFPENLSSRGQFVLNIIRKRLNGKIPRRISICSKIRKNLLEMQKELYSNFKILSLVSKKRINGLGNYYYELNINRLEDIEKIKTLL